MHLQLTASGYKQDYELAVLLKVLWLVQKWLTCGRGAEAGLPRAPWRHRTEVGPLWYPLGTLWGGYRVSAEGELAGWSSVLAMAPKDLWARTSQLCARLFD